eukprot:superscaffoldBa00002393_g14105
MAGYIQTSPEVSLQSDAELLRHSGHCSKDLRTWLFSSIRLRCHNALFGPSSLSPHLMPSQQASFKSDR